VVAAGGLAADRRVSRKGGGLNSSSPSIFKENHRAGSQGGHLSFRNLGFGGRWGVRVVCMLQGVGGWVAWGASYCNVADLLH